MPARVLDNRPSNLSGAASGAGASVIAPRAYAAGFGGEGTRREPALIVKLPGGLARVRTH